MIFNWTFYQNLNLNLKMLYLTLVSFHLNDEEINAAQKSFEVPRRSRILQTKICLPIEIDWHVNYWEGISSIDENIRCLMRDKVLFNDPEEWMNYVVFNLIKHCTIHLISMTDKHEGIVTLQIILAFSLSTLLRLNFTQNRVQKLFIVPNFLLIEINYDWFPHGKLLF